MRAVRRVLVTLLAMVLMFWAGAVGFLWANESRFVYRAAGTRVYDSDFSNWTLPRHPYTGVVLASTDGLQLDGVALEHPAAESRYWIIHFNGAASSIHRRRYREQLRQLHTLGYNVLSFDYRGFGRNGGTPTETGLYEDALAAYHFLTRERGVEPGRVILAGRSLGSAVAIELATRVRSAGVILLSPIDSVPLVGSRWYWWAPVSLLARNQFDSLSKIPRVTVPVVIAHAVNDRFVPIDAGRSLYAATIAPKVMVETGGGHVSAGFSPISDLAEALDRFWPVAPLAGT